MSAESVTSQRHNDYVGGDASQRRIPGADKAATGHQYLAIFPKGGENRPQEHLPPTTGRDAPPAANVPPVGRNIRQIVPGDQQPDVTSNDESHLERLTAARSAGEPYPLPAAPDSRTVIDRSPYATPASAGDTLRGATSADVHAGLGHPGAGMSSAEAHHDGRSHRTRQGGGLDQFGSGEIPREVPTEAEQPGEMYKSGSFAGAQERRLR